MNRINKLFNDRAKKDLLSVYFCAGYPTLNSTVEIITELERQGIDMIEVGIPFSDPMADGPVIQNAATQALRNGMTLRLLFQQLRDIRHHIHLPLVLMGYLNPIMQYGFENFCRSCVECGIDGVIIPDLPYRDYMEHYRIISERYNIKVIMLITPETSEERIRLIDEHTDGFIYFQRIQSMNLQNPRMIGFGISNKQTFQSACKYAAGAIIGSKFVTLLGEEGNPEKAVSKLLEALKE